MNLLPERSWTVEHQQQLQLLVENIEDYAIFLLDTEGRVMTWTKRAAAKTKGGVFERTGRDSGPTSPSPRSRMMQAFSTALERLPVTLPSANGPWKPRSRNCFAPAPTPFSSVPSTIATSLKSMKLFVNSSAIAAKG